MSAHYASVRPAELDPRDLHEVRMTVRTFIMSSPSLLTEKLPLPIVLAGALFLVQILFTFPGELDNDSRGQLAQALSRQFADWHPPVMALVWSWLIRLGGGAGSLLVLQQLLHWLGLGLIADGCYRIGRRREAWVIAAAGAFPVFLFYDKAVVKDAAMTSAFVAGTGLIVWFIVQNRRVPLWAVLLSSLCLLYGALIRTNAVFAIAPLLLLYFRAGRQLGIPKIIACAVLTAIVAVPLSSVINHRLIGAKAEYPIQSVQLFDLMGIAVHSADNRVMGDDPPPETAIRACYTSYAWDTVSPWGICNGLRRGLGYPLDLETPKSAAIARTAQLWRSAILEHPMAYLAHRAENFNSSLYFVVPALHYRYSKFTELAPYGAKIITQRDIYFDYFKKNFFFWPIVWVFMGFSVLVLLQLSVGAPITLRIARLLILSALLYAGAYLVVGVGTAYRYYYWTIMATLLGAILASREIGAVIRLRRRPAILAFGGLLLIIMVGLAARIADVRFV